MNCKKVMTASAAIEKLQEFIGKLSVLGEDEIVTLDAYILTTQNCISDILYDQSGEEELEKQLNTIPPHILHDYFLYTEEAARDTDGYWDAYSEARSNYFYDEIKPRFTPSEENEE